MKQFEILIRGGAPFKIDSQEWHMTFSTSDGKTVDINSDEIIYIKEVKTKRD